MIRLRTFSSFILAAFLLSASWLLAQSGVTAVLPNGREIHPAGNWIPVAPYPFALAVRPDGAQIAVPSIGFPFALNVISDPASNAPAVQRMPSGFENDPAIETHTGLAYSADGSLLYVATGDSGKIRAYHTSDWKSAGALTLDGPIAGKEYSGSFAATLIVSKDDKTLYALDQGNWRIILIDAHTMQRVASISTGNYPFGLALSPNGERLYVTNTGLFEYTTIPGASAKDPLGTGLHFPPFGYPSKAAREGTVVEGKKIAGLGDENSDRGSSLWTYDVRGGEHPALTAKLHLGTQITEARGQTVGGAAPTGIAADNDAVYVSLAHQDAVAKISADGTRLLNQTALSPFAQPRFKDASGRPLRGVMPSGLAVRDGRIYVAESGIDAVGVIDSASMQVVSHIPVGWNPSAVAFSPNGKMLYVINTKGKGAGPNAGAGHDPKTPTYVGSLELGSISAIPLDGQPPADESTKTVIAANTAAIANRPQLPRLKHCFLVIRENRTYDEVLGDVAGANGDPTLGPLWHGRMGRRRKIRDPPACHTQPARARGPLRHERQLLRRLRCFRRRPPLGHGHQPHALFQYRLDLRLRWTPSRLSRLPAVRPARTLRRRRRAHA
jgi:YVTN family beta-propeller protein